MLVDWTFRVGVIPVLFVQYAKLHFLASHKVLIFPSHHFIISSKSINNMTSTSTPQEIFTLVDLESSIGRIDDTEMSDVTEKVKPVECSARTSLTYPFKQRVEMSIDQAESHPYPFSETIKEREERNSNFESFICSSVAETTETQQMGGSISDEDEWGLDPTETDDDSHQFYLEEEALKMTKSGLELEKIGDPVSFWQG